MFIRGFVLKATIALGLIAVVALPGQAKPEPSRASALPAIAKPAAQQTFGLFLDPHAEPVLHIELPKSPFAV